MLDYADATAVDEFHDELSAMMINLRLHAVHEEAIIHPLLAAVYHAVQNNWRRSIARSNI